LNDFRYRFNQAFGGQLDQLKMQYGNLTHAEERIYALEKLNVSTGQIAWMLGISPESVRKTRYRLRKKIGTEI
jgi:DNA-binding CsgD family transcriptional regulator